MVHVSGCGLTVPFVSPKERFRILFGFLFGFFFVLALVVSISFVVALALEV